MRNLQLIKDPREHFAIFWKGKSPDGQERVAELQESFDSLVQQIREGTFLSRCATVELLPPSSETPDEQVGVLLSNEQADRGSASPQKVPGIYWVVPSDLLEVALLACEIARQQQENEQGERDRLSAILAEQGD